MDQWIVQVEESLGNMESRSQEEEGRRGNDVSEKRCIYRIPAHIRKNQDDKFVYKPKRVSFGPYYHDDKRCRPREKDKEAALLHFLKRHKRPLRDYKDALLEVVEELKDAYDQLDPEWQQDTDAFLKMMILDGCFLLEILQGASNPLSYYAPDNPVLRIYENHSEMEDFKHDMLLLENQLPMRLLDRLLHVQQGGLDSVVTYSLNLSILHNRTWPVLVHTSVGFLHILDASRPFGGVNSVKAKAKAEANKSSLSSSMPSATELQDAGIAFKANFLSAEISILLRTLKLEDPINFPTDMSFRHRTLTLPNISVDGAMSKSMFLNIIAFEKLHKDAGTKFTSYIYFMQSLIRSANDVSLLQSRGIIKSALPDGEVARLFDSFSKDMILLNLDSLDDNYLEAAKSLRKRFDKIMAKEWRKDLYQKYLRSPWTIISVIAGSLLLILTIIQTVYSILSYHRK